jgi:dolichyl-phosphate-mannose-protein mannosyltransferase
MLKRASALAAGILLFCVLALSSMRMKSATYDEPIYVTAGYTHLALRDFRVNPQTPPLAKMIAAAPLLALDVTFRTDDVAWREGYQNKLARQFFYRWNDAGRILFWTRLPIVALACLLAAAVYLWTRRRFGQGPAAVALLLCVLSPDVLAHGQIATTDVALALFLFLTVVLFERVVERVTFGRVLLAGLALGAALATKVSAVVLFPLLAVLSFRAGRSRLKTMAGALLAMTLTAWGVLWFSHGFQPAVSSDPRAPAYDWSTMPEDHGAGRVLALARASHLLPEPYLYGLAFRVAANSEATEGVANAFLLGRTSETGFWYYFPATFALKTPLPLIVMLAGALVLTLRRGWRWCDTFVWLPAAAYASLMMAQRLNLGHRYLLPVYPFLFVAAAGFAAWAMEREAPRWRRWLLGALLAWYAVGTLRIHPHYLAYFNELAGGPRNGYRRLVDSSLDWGQDLPGLKAYQDRHGLASLKLSYFGMADPEYYGIRCQRLPGFPPPSQMATEVNPGDVVAVSATNLQSVRLDQGRRLMRRLRETEPVDQVGYSILIYRPDFHWTLEQER